MYCDSLSYYEVKAQYSALITFVEAPLSIVCEKGHKDIAKMLLDKQADINIQSLKGATPLYMACQQSHEDIVKMLLDKQADLYDPNSKL